MSGWEADPARDMRPVIKEHIALKHLLCPTTDQVDLSPEGNKSPNAVQATQVFASYDVWFAWKYLNEGGPMSKIGDRFGFNDATDGNKLVQSRLLVNDVNLNRNDHFAISTHPDADGVMALETHQNGDVGVGGLISFSNIKLTISLWEGGGGTVVRGPVELNMGFDDGSVARYNFVVHSDPRLRPAPAFAVRSNDNGNRYGLYIPAD